VAILPIKLYPDPVLRRAAQPVAVIDARLRQLAADMVETMESAEGVGLAAPQVGESLRLVIVDMNPGEGDPRVLINPVINKRSGRKELRNEGCLSFPGLRTKIKRNPVVICEAQNLDGEVVEYRVEGLAAQAVQHEIDHLDGMLFVDKAGPSDKQSIQPELEEMDDNYRELHP
jgi:peptide deformylase